MPQFSPTGNGVPSRGRRGRWLTALVAVVALLAVGLWRLLTPSKPAVPFAESPPPAAPDYARRSAWFAYPGAAGLAQSTPPGRVPNAAPPVDVFFIPPTTFLKSDRWNAGIDVAGKYDDVVMLNQASAFNDCCRIFAPHYRQASLYALNNERAAVDLAYSDVERAFRWYVEHDNGGRPFFIASHSQGSGHAGRLLQRAILGTPLQQRLIAAYVVGAFVSSEFPAIGLPVCDAPDQTGCVVSWNTSQEGRRGAERLTERQTYWWQGRWRFGRSPPAVCVNPLTWRADTASAPASANPGSDAPLFDQMPAKAPITLPPLRVGLTGARCDRGLLMVDVPLSARPFQGTLSVVLGSYHVVDYGLFYESVRRNAVVRADAWRRAHRATPE